MPFPFPCIVITADEAYSKMWHTQLVYAEYLSQKTRLVYMDPPAKWKLTNLALFFKTNTRLENEIRVAPYLNPLPSFSSLFRKINEWRSQKMLLKLLALEKGTQLLIWHFDSYRNSLDADFFVSQFNIKRVYHVIDPFYNNPINNLLCSLANLIVLTSARNQGQYAAYANKFIVVPQCIDLERTEKMLQPEPTFKSPKPYFVLLGTISDDLDFTWLLNLTENEKFNLVLIGKQKRLEQHADDFKKLSERKNVKVLGLMSPAEFYPVLKNAIAGLIVYGDYRRDKVFSPLKAINYLAAGIPLVTNIECEIRDLQEPFIYKAYGYFEFELTLKSLLENKPELDKTELSNFLQKHSLATAIETILQNT